MGCLKKSYRIRTAITANHINFFVHNKNARIQAIRNVCPSADGRQTRHEAPIRDAAIYHDSVDDHGFGRVRCVSIQKVEQADHDDHHVCDRAVAHVRSLVLDSSPR